MKTNYTPHKGLLEQLYCYDRKDSLDLRYASMHIGDIISNSHTLTGLQKSDVQTYLWIKFKDCPIQLRSFISNVILVCTGRVFMAFPSFEPTQYSGVGLFHLLRKPNLHEVATLFSASKPFKALCGYETSERLLKQSKAKKLGVQPLLLVLLFISWIKASTTGQPPLSNTRTWSDYFKPKNSKLWNYHYFMKWVITALLNILNGDTDPFCIQAPVRPSDHHSWRQLEAKTWMTIYQQLSSL